MRMCAIAEIDSADAESWAPSDKTMIEQTYGKNESGDDGPYGSLSGFRTYDLFQGILKFRSISTSSNGLHRSISRKHETAKAGGIPGAQ